MIYSTLWSDLPVWREHVSVIDRRRLRLVDFERAIGRCRAGDALIVNGAVGWSGRWRDVASAAATRAVARGVAVVVSDATWQPRAERGTSRAGPLFAASDQLNRFLVRRLVGPRSRFCFLSEGEVADFEEAVPGAAGTGVFTPFTYQLPDRLTDPDELVGAVRQPFVFTGGNTLRDWPLLIDALADTGLPVCVAAQPGDRSWPANFDVASRSEEEFFRLAAAARVGVLALRADVVRSCGQQTYLNLLRVGTPVVVNDAPGVREHLSGVPGARIVGDAGAMAGAVGEWFAEAAQPGLRELAAQGAAAVAEHYSPATYFARLVEVARKAQASG